uniref:BLOC-1-related complex subunit 5 n=1 Tax=Panagrolaimus sp. JU765 TaxID=591449 RepID=A0AC34QNL3_9BILA
MSEQQFFERVVCKPLAFGVVKHSSAEKTNDEVLNIPSHVVHEVESDAPPNKQEKVKPWDDKRPLFMKSQIVVVNAAGQPIGDAKDDEDLKKLNEIQRFMPLLKGCLPGYRDSPEIYNKIDAKPFVRFAYRFQTHLAICAQVVNSEQSSVFSRIVQTDQAMTAVSTKLSQNSRQFERLCEELKKVKELQERLDAVDLLLQEIVPAMEALNDFLPEKDRLPPFCLVPKSSYSSIGSSTPSTPALSTSTASPEQIEQAEECAVVDLVEKP